MIDNLILRERGDTFNNMKWCVSVCLCDTVSDSSLYLLAGLLHRQLGKFRVLSPPHYNHALAVDLFTEVCCTYGKRADNREQFVNVLKTACPFLSKSGLGIISEI